LKGPVIADGNPNLSVTEMLHFSFDDIPKNYIINWKFVEVLFILTNTSKKLFQDKYF